MIVSHATESSLDRQALHDLFTMTFTLVLVVHSCGDINWRLVLHAVPTTTACEYFLCTFPVIARAWGSNATYLKLRVVRINIRNLTIKTVHVRLSMLITINLWVKGGVLLLETTSPLVIQVFVLNEL